MAYARLLKNINFLELWFAQVTSQIAQNLLNFALIIRVFDLAKNTRYANMAVSFLILAFAIPSIIFAVFAGSYIDHLDRKKVLVISNLLRAILALLFLVFENNLFMIYGLIFVISTITQFFFPAEGAALPNMVKDKKDYPSANSLFVFTLYSSFIIGYSLAGPVIKNFGSRGVYFITAIAFALAMVSSILLPKMKAITHKSIHWLDLARKVFKTITADTKMIFRKKHFLFPIMQMTVAQAIISVIIVLAPSLAILVLNQDLTTASSILILPVGIGTIFGAILVGQLFKRTNKYLVIKIAVAIAGICLIMIPLAKLKLKPPVIEYAIMAIVFLLGFMNAVIAVSAQTLLQIHSEDEIRGRVFGILNMMINIAATIPVLFAGITADLVSATSVIAFVGIILIVFDVIQIIVFKNLKSEKVDLHNLRGV